MALSDLKEFANNKIYVTKNMEFISHKESGISSSPNDKILALMSTKLKAFADNKFNDAKIMQSIFDRVEIIAGKGENASYQHFLPYEYKQCFQKLSFS